MKLFSLWRGAERLPGRGSRGWGMGVWAWVGRVKGLWGRRAGSSESEESLVSWGVVGRWDGGLWLPESQLREQTANDSF